MYRGETLSERESHHERENISARAPDEIQWPPPAIGTDVGRDRKCNCRGTHRLRRGPSRRRRHDYRERRSTADRNCGAAMIMGHTDTVSIQPGSSELNEIMMLPADRWKIFVAMRLNPGLGVSARSGRRKSGPVRACARSVVRPRRMRLSARRAGSNTPRDGSRVALRDARQPTLMRRAEE
jgi:hypothetical protein